MNYRKKKFEKKSFICSIPILGNTVMYFIVNKKDYTNSCIYSGTPTKFFKRGDLPLRTREGSYDYKFKTELPSAFLDGR